MVQFTHVCISSTLTNIISLHPDAYISIGKTMLASHPGGMGGGGGGGGGGGVGVAILLVALCYRNL